MINKIERTYKASHETKNANVIIASIYYNKGGANFYSYKNEERGYYFSIIPEEQRGCMHIYEGFSGVKTCILPVNRQSKKSFEVAKSMLEKYIDLYLDDYCNDNGFTIDKSNYTEKESERNV